MSSYATGNLEERLAAVRESIDRSLYDMEHGTRSNTLKRASLRDLRDLEQDLMTQIAAQNGGNLTIGYQPRR